MKLTSWIHSADAVQWMKMIQLVLFNPDTGLSFTLISPHWSNGYVCVCLSLLKWVSWGYPNSREVTEGGGRGWGGVTGTTRWPHSKPRRTEQSPRKIICTRFRRTFFFFSPWGFGFSWSERPSNRSLSDVIREHIVGIFLFLLFLRANADWLIQKICTYSWNI